MATGEEDGSRQGPPTEKRPCPPRRRLRPLAEAVKKASCTTKTRSPQGRCSCKQDLLAAGYHAWLLAAAPAKAAPEEAHRCQRQAAPGKGLHPEAS